MPDIDGEPTRDEALQEAAATAASEAVASVQQEAARDDAIAEAETGSVMAQIEAETATEAATEAATVAETAAVVAAVSAEQTAVIADEVTTFEQRTEARFAENDRRHEEFAAEVRGFLARIDEHLTPRTPEGVQEVEVTNHGGTPNTSTANGSDSQHSGAGERRDSRRRFGNRR